MTKPGRMILFIFTIMFVLAACSDSQAIDFAVGSLPHEAETGSPVVPEDADTARCAVITEEIQAIPPYPKTLSETVYPEYILLSENFWTATEIYSPIDHAYNQSRLQADFIDSFAGEYEIIWRQELEYQYHKCIQNMPEEYKEKFALQQLAWEEYVDNDVFPEIAQIHDEEDNNIGGYGFVREAALIRLDRVRTRTIEIMRMQTHIDGLNVAFSMENTFYPDLDHISGLFSLGRNEVLERLGGSYEIVPPRGERTEEAYHYFAYGMTIVFERDFPDRIDWIACDETVDVNGARLGMTFAEILTYLPDSDIHDLRPNFLEPYYPMFSLTYRFENVIVWFGAMEAREWMDIGEDLDMDMDKTIALEIRRNHILTEQ